MSAAIRLESVTLRQDGQATLDRLSLEVAPGEMLALLGPSGSGKTSLLRVVLGFAKPEVGSVLLDERVVSRDGRLIVPPEERGLAVVFQDLALWPHLTVADNLGFGLQAKGVLASERSARIDDMLRRVGLQGSEGRFPGELSGGERQRVAIARALVMRPRAVLLDEPLASVDVDLRRELLALFRELFAEGATTVLHVTHDLREATALARRFVVLESGRVVQQGALAELAAAPATPFVESLVEDLRGPSGRRGNDGEERAP